MTPSDLARTLVAWTVTAAAIVGCGGDGVDEVACTAEVRASVVVQVVDGAGRPLAGATVSYRVDGGPARAAECAEPVSACTRFVAGREEAGSFTILATMPGFKAATVTLEVQRDVCHVMSREVALVLVPG